jgi:hypothetical protein
MPEPLFRRVPVCTRALLGLASAFASACSSPAPPTESSTIVVPYQITTQYSLEQDGDNDLTARARYYDSLQFFDWFGNEGTIELSPGDHAYADGKPLDIETKSTLAGKLRVDYSQTIATGKDAYTFELRRPNDEAVRCQVPAPEPMEVSASDTVAFAVLSWKPVLEGATVEVELATDQVGCGPAVLVGPIATNVADEGRYQFDPLPYRSADHECTYGVAVRRRHQGSTSSTWRRGSTELPGNSIYVATTRTDRTTLTLAKR